MSNYILINLLKPYIYTYTTSSPLPDVVYELFLSLQWLVFVAKKSCITKERIHSDDWQVHKL